MALDLGTSGLVVRIKMWIKICGNTSLEDAQLAVESGADAVGFVFASSPRHVTEAQVRRITDKLPAGVETYGVFVDAPFAQIVAAVETCRLSGVQLHCAPDRMAADAAENVADHVAGVGGNGLRFRLREHFAERGQTIRIIPVIRWCVKNKSAAQAGIRTNPSQPFLEYRRDPSVDAVLVDSFSTKAVGGTGTSFDWEQARSQFLEASSNLRVIVAGGLRPENVRQAIRILRPWGVDVVSGVEAFPGKKDPARVLAFIHAARQAADSLDDLATAATDQSIHSGARALRAVLKEKLQ
jgi:phosphoribosylanthranilate isomerase